MDPHDTTSVARAFFDGIAAGESEAVAALIDDDVRWSLGHVSFALRVAGAIPGVSVPDSGVWEGKQAALTQMLGPVLQMYVPDSMRLVVEDIIAQDDRAVVFLHMTVELVSRVEYENDYVIVMRVRDGKLVQVDEYADTLRWVSQFAEPEAARL